MPFDPSWKPIDYKQYGQIVQQTGNTQLARGYTMKSRKRRKPVTATPRRRVRRSGG
jgi:hypothetical protein